ncbi:hypothetical protein PP938_gp126 [Rhizobium phage AF3]|uniref:Uncharacterized protein n=1 Tax=Rhizobium phage AF3 TaxID=2763529 RepID=A0A7G7WWF0_9CAUD|nr:hypothetical protein PP938_gp126 [Rhizobium phage AF3]QNH71544.1 hypothetical protein AF3_126 [Rhizobium phage AF3]
MKQLAIGQCVDIHVIFNYREGFKYLIKPVETRYNRREGTAIGRVWRLSKNTYRYSNYTGSRSWISRVYGRDTTFNSAYNNLIRRSK